MKTIFTYILLIISSIAFAQKIEVTEVKENFQYGLKNSFVVSVYENSTKKIEKEFKSLLKDRKPKKIEENNGEYIADDALFTEWNKTFVDIFFKTKENKKGEVQLISAYSIGEDFISSEKAQDKTDLIKKMLIDFAYNLSAEALNDQIKDAKGEVSDLESKIKNLEKDNKGLEGDIENYKDKIKQAENDCKDNEKAQDRAKDELDKLKKKEFSNKEEQEKETEKLEDKIKDLSKNNKSYHKDIDSYKNKIDRAKDDIKSNENAIDKAKSDLKDANKKVDDLKSRVDSLK